MADLTPIPVGIPWDPWDPSLPHSHAHLYSADASVTTTEVLLSKATAIVVHVEQSVGSFCVNRAGFTSAENVWPKKALAKFGAF